MLRIVIFGPGSSQGISLLRTAKEYSIVITSELGYHDDSQKRHSEAYIHTLLVHLVTCSILNTFFVAHSTPTVMASSVLPAGIPSNITVLTGPPLLGVNFNCLLYGILLVQYYMYCVRFEVDKTWIKILVHLLFCLETAQTAMTIADSFYWFASGFGDMDKLAQYHLSPFDVPIMTVLIATIAQGVYCWRIWCIAKRKLCCLVIVLAALMQAAGGLAVGIVNQRLLTVTRWEQECSIFTAMWGIGNAIADAAIAITMMSLLYQQKRRLSGMGRDNGILTRIVKLTVETNAMTAIVATVHVLVILIPETAPPKTSIFMCAGYVLGKLYSNSFMAMLNNRDFLNREDIFRTASVNVHFNDRLPLAIDSTDSSSSRNVDVKHPDTPINITITRSQIRS